MLSVIIATYNRSEFLKDTLNCLLKQNFNSHADFEVLIVDNNSKDNTKTVVESFLNLFQGKLKYFFEPKQGKVFALNLGIKESKGEILILTDDDCAFNDNYVKNIHEFFQNASSDIGFIGGKIIPQWFNCSKPSWFVELKEGWWYKDFFWGPIGKLDYGETPLEIKIAKNESETNLLYGANLVVKKDLFIKYGLFDIQKKVAEDTEIQFRFLKNGIKGMYVPNLQVYHKITSDKITPTHFYEWYFLRGKLMAIQKKYKRKFYHPFGVQLELIGSTINLYIASYCSTSLSDRIYKRCQALFNLGQIIQIIQQRKNV